MSEQTLNLWTSSIVAVLPSDTQEWKNDGATDTPKASDVIPVPRNNMKVLLVYFETYASARMG